MKSLKHIMVIALVSFFAVSTAHAETMVWSGKRTIQLIENPGVSTIMLGFGIGALSGCQNNTWARFTEGLHGNQAKDIDRHLSMAMTAMTMGMEVDILYDQDSPNCTIKYLVIYR